MTREEAKELLPIMQAYIEGKTIQRLIGDTWEDADDTNIKLHLTASPSHYRIKPEPKYRPFKTQEECWDEMHKHPDFGWVRDKKSKCYIHISLMRDYTDINGQPYDSAFSNYTFTDGTPFGIKEK